METKEQVFGVTRYVFAYMILTKLPISGIIEERFEDPDMRIRKNGFRVLDKSGSRTISVVWI